MRLPRVIAVVAFVAAAASGGDGRSAVYPGIEWAAKRPAELGLDAGRLKELSDYAGGFGCVVRGGYMVYAWGDAARRKDVASAVKPFYTHFLLKAIEDGAIASIDEPLSRIEPRLQTLNKRLGYKDRRITWRHLCNQVSCYGVEEPPGEAFDYSDYNMALFFDSLFLKVYGSTWEKVDSDVLRPQLTDLLQCQDNPTFMAFGPGNRPGRLAISPRDFARFGLLYLRKGRWKDRQLISVEHAEFVPTRPLPVSIPRTRGKSADMIAGQRSIGGGNNQCDHAGSYSNAWWVNGVGRDGRRNWPDAPPDVYGCFGHGDIRAMVVMPSLDLIVAWNETRIEGHEKVNHALKLLSDAVTTKDDSAGAVGRKVGGDIGNKTAPMWQCKEWTLDNVTHSGNPFDVAAKVTFSHADSAAKRTTEMFHDGGNMWKFRFTGTRLGDWTFVTKSDVAGLNGRTGTVTVIENTDPKAKGFLANIGNRFVVQAADESDLRGYLFNAYMSRVKFSASLEKFGPDLARVEMQAKAYFEDALANGFEILFIHVNNNWFRFGSVKHSQHESESPDPLTFRILDRIITTVHRMGGRVHIWAWGDESRQWTPRGVAGGINGPADRRLQRYIAARLGPMPGWTMGYGFDLHEWTSLEQLNSWADYLHDRFGWQHFLSARGQRLEGPYNMNSYDGFGRGVPLTTISHGPVDYSEIAQDLDGDLTRPHLYEERHSYKRDGFKLDMEGTRRLLWAESMAGGMGGFFGFYPTSPHPYPNPEQLRTHYTFWHVKGRFLADMKRANGLTEGGFVLQSVPSDCFVFYKESASSVDMDLSAMKSGRPALAVDTCREYAEIDLGMLDNKRQTWNAPHRSDWAIAVGHFAEPSVDASDGPRDEPRRQSGRIVADKEHPAWLMRQGGGAFFMCGPGDPEGFLYRGRMLADGTRDGDQMPLIEKLKTTGANCIYLMAVRSHGGDGDRTHNPFVDNDPAKGVNAKVLDQWAGWFAEMDAAGIVTYFFFYDDSARIWDTGDGVGPAERDFLKTIVDKFEHHRNLIWCVAEEYGERLSAARVKAIAAEIRTADDYDHPIAVHKNHGLDFSEFADDENIDQFAIQYNAGSAEELHAGVVEAWRKAAGRYSLNMSEAADWGAGAEARRKSWACAMGGAYVMILGMDIEGTPRSDLEDCGRLVSFFESTNFDEMAPHDELRAGATQYVLAGPPDSYIAYTTKAAGKIGLKDMEAGAYSFMWFDCATGARIRLSDVRVQPGDQAWARPEGIGPEAALYLKRNRP